MARRIYLGLMMFLVVVVLSIGVLGAKDSDNDGIPNDQDRYPYDYDNDGMPDVWERKYGLRTDVDDADKDYDKDGLSNIEEYHAIKRNPVVDESGQTAPNCFDRIVNQGEEDIDCGGPCKECSDRLSPKSGLFSFKNMIIGGALVMLILVLVLVLVLTGSKKKKVVQTQMTGPQFSRQELMARNYVYKMVSKGYSKAQVRASFIKQGWQRQQIDKIFKSLGY